MFVRKLVAFGALLSLVPVGAKAQGISQTRTIASDVRELPADQQIIQALSRLTFGARPGDVQKVRSVGLDKWIDQQLHPDKINDDAMNAFVSRYAALNENQSDLLAKYAEQQRARQQVKRDRADTTSAMSPDEVAMMQQARQLNATRRQVTIQLQSSRVARAVASERQLQEVMTD